MYQVQELIILDSGTIGNMLRDYMYQVQGLLILGSGTVFHVQIVLYNKHSHQRQCSVDKQYGLYSFSF